MKTILAPFAAWTQANPIRSPLLMCLCSLLGIFIAFLAFTGDWENVPPILLTVAAITVTITGAKKTATLLLCAALFLHGANLNAEEPEQPPEPSGFVVGAIVVLVVGAVVYYQLRGFCQRHLPRPPTRGTNAAPYALITPASEGDDYAATWVFIGWMSCDLEAAGASQLPVITMELRGTAHRTDNGIEWRLSQTRLEPELDLVDAAEYERILLAEHGVRTGKSSGDRYFAINGVPCTQWESPIQFSTNDDGRPNVAIGQGELFDGVMQRSTDLENWQDIGRAQVGEGQPIVMTDMTVSGQMFYRFRPQ